IITVHELEHINNPQDALSCNICIVDDNVAIADLTGGTSEHHNLFYKVMMLENQLLLKHIQKFSNHSNAPPHLS
ncbi:MAG: hypothetical protein JXQ66_04660, partial [Campylobacterales bacterium]|nr:hypothetical protein [Campylobacterales bacterium]